jgi:hypothetical protein
VKPISLYQQVMGGDFIVLPTPLRHFHSLEGNHVLDGWVEVQAPASLAARILARCLGAPLDAQRGPIRFELTAGATSEVWTRHFPGRTMTSTLTLAAGRIVERLGPARLSFALKGGPEFLEMRLVGLHFLGLPCPRWLLPKVLAEETAADGRLQFRVQASLPLIGVVAAYQGHLDLPDGEPRSARQAA